MFSKIDKSTAQLEFQHMPGTPEYERIISGVWMMPDTKYYRNVDGFEFTVSLTKEDLKKALVNYLKNDKANQFDIEHSGVTVENMVSLEHWIIEDSTTASPVMGYTQEMLGYKSLPVGTVMKTVYVRDPFFFEEFILSNKVNGFSIEGLFYMNQMNQNFSTMIAQTNKFTEMFKQLGLDNQRQGTLITELGNLSFNTDGIKFNEEIVVDGEFKTKHNFNIVIRQGNLVEFGFNDVTTELPSSTEAPVVNTEVVVEVNTTETQQNIENITPEQVEKAFNEAALEVAETVKSNLRKEIDELKGKLSEQDKLTQELNSSKEESNKMKEEIEKLKADIKAEADKKAKATPVKGSIKPLPVVDDTKYRTRTKGGIDYKIPVK